MKHELAREFGGRDESSWIKPVCSCGWEGYKVYAYNDYQRTLVKEQECAHLIAVNDK